ncbi:MAG TPA: alpha-galactosidase [Rubrivivax sp.]|nr:alpha-galactosidase [Rubrivivax sp.]
MNARFFRLDGAGVTQLWASFEQQLPRLLHWGAPLPPDADLAALALATAAPIPQGGLDVAEVISWLPEAGRGFTDLPGFELRRGEHLVTTALTLREAMPTSTVSGSGWCFDCVDEQAGLALKLSLALHPGSGVCSAGCTLTNTGVEPLSVQSLATVCLPLPQTAAERYTIGGTWSAEFRALREPIGSATWQQEARTGRSSHHAFPGMTLLERGTDATQGQAWSAQIAWSGNHRMTIQQLRLGGAQWQLGELLLPGEVLLQPGEQHVAPSVHLLYSGHGLRALSTAWHRFVRERVLPAQPADRARRVQFNTWEATYFDHDPARLQQLASAAARLGVERFVLDDGWFGSRRHDKAGLGDWWPAPELYPQGLAPLAAHCRALGMQFGLWLEPEGVNADSELFRAHPDWVLRVPGREQPLGRHQYVLDLGREAVREHLFSQLAAVLRSAPIDFVKWDMNRDFTHAGGDDGRMGVREHVRGLYMLLARLREAFPQIEIETCASGGARADLGMLAHARRVWVSDCNDPVERQAMQAAFLHFLPAEIMGSHVGPERSHTTGRSAGIAFRTQTAVLGHFGIEADVTALPPDDALHLQQALRAYKDARGWLADAAVTAIDTHDPALVAVLAVSADGHRAWLSLAAISRRRSPVPGLLRVPGLMAGRVYDIRTHALWPAPGLDLKVGGLLDRGGSVALDAGSLARVGLRLPALRPGTGCLVELQRV